MPSYSNGYNGGGGGFIQNMQASNINRLGAAGNGLDLFGAGGGHGHRFGSFQGGLSDAGSDSCFSINVCPDLIFAAVAAAAAVGVYYTYTAITTKGRKRRKRDTWLLSQLLPQLMSIG